MKRKNICGVIPTTSKRPLCPGHWILANFCPQKVLVFFFVRRYGVVVAPGRVVVVRAVK